MVYTNRYVYDSRPIDDGINYIKVMPYDEDMREGFMDITQPNTTIAILLLVAIIVIMLLYVL